MYSVSHYVRFLSQAMLSGIVDLGATDFNVVIRYKDNGTDKEVATKLSKLKSLKDNGGSTYTVIKAGYNMLGDMSSVSIASDTYILMKETDMIKQSKNINSDINKILETYSSCN